MEKLSTALTVVHAEDDPLWRDAISGILRSLSTVEYVAGARDGRETLVVCLERQPHVALIDLRLPDTDGFQLADQLLALPQPPRILFLTCRADDVALFHAWSGRYAGLIWKSSRSAEQLRDAFAALSAGKRYFPPEVLTAVNRFRSLPEAFFKILSPREQGLIEALTRGESNANIATATGLSHHTVHTHRKRIMAKLNVHTLRDLMLWGAERGFNTSLTRTSFVDV